MTAAARLDAGEIIFGVLGQHLGDLAAHIAAAADAAALARLAPRIRDIASGLLAYDAGAGLVTRIIAEFNDRLTRRVIAIVERDHRLPAAAWCWLAYGSEGRSEQTFATDQDNGLMFSAASGSEAHAMRQLFQPFAHAVNKALAACGFPLCAGEVMAGNPAWCLSAEEWRQRFGTWIYTPDPQALLNATIFFDFRVIYGDATLAAGLRDYLLGLTGVHNVFIRMMAGNALAVAPPLGLLGDIVGVDEAHGGVNLKKQGARLFVDAARIFALAAGLPALGTVARLHAVAQAGKLSAKEAVASVQAFEHLQRLRLELQVAALKAGREPGNLARRAQLGEFSERLLKESLKQAGRLQQKMKLAFHAEA